MKSIITVLFFSTLILSGMTQTACPPCRNQQVSNTYALAGSKDIGTFDLASGVFTLLSTITGVAMNRITVTPDNEVYGSTNTQIYKINPADGSIVAIGSGTGRLLQTFAFGPNGVLYAIDIDNNFCEIDLTTGVASVLFDIAGYNDLAYGMVWDPIDQIFYFTSEDGNGNGSQLATLTLDGTFTLTTLLNPLYELVNGLFLDGETLIGINYTREILTIDKTTGLETQTGTVTGTTSNINTVIRASTCESPSRRVLLARKKRLL